MTRQKWKELMPVVQAWADGKAIQFRDSKIHECQWIDAVADLTFEAPGVEYRIKPEPREFHIHLECEKIHQFLVCPPLPEEGWIKVREVLE